MIQSFNSMEILYPYKDIVNWVKQISSDIKSLYKDDKVLFIVVKNGACRFFYHIQQEIEYVLRYDYKDIKVSSYTGMKKDQIKCKGLKDINWSLYDKVIIVEDIIDTGDTIKYLVNEVGKSGFTPCIVSLLVRESSLDKLVNLDVHYGFVLRDNEFVVGFGMDLDEKLRDLNDICKLINN